MTDMRNEKDVDWIARTRRGDEPEPEQKQADATWVPYSGPQGGEGWKNTQTGDKVYDDEPPGEVDLSELEEYDLVNIAHERFDLGPGKINELIDGADGREDFEELIRDRLGIDDAPPEPDKPSDSGEALKAENLSGVDEVVIDGEEAEVSQVTDMGGGYFIAGETDDGGKVTARVGPDVEFEKVVTETTGLAVEAADVSEGDRVVIDDTRCEVSKVSDMGGGYYVAARDDEGEVHTARVGPDVEFETWAEDAPEDVIPGREVGAYDVDEAAREGWPAEINGHRLELNDVDWDEMTFTDQFGREMPLSTYQDDEHAIEAIHQDADADLEEPEYGPGERFEVEVTQNDVRQHRVDHVRPPWADGNRCHGEEEVVAEDGQRYCVSGVDRRLDDEYDVEPGTFGAELAAATKGGETLNTNELASSLGQVDDPHLVADALEAELDGPGRKSAVDRLEGRLRSIGGGPSPQDVRERFKETGGGGGTKTEIGFDELEEGKRVEVDGQPGEITIEWDDGSYTFNPDDGSRRRIRPDDVEAIRDPSLGDDYPGPFSSAEDELGALDKNAKLAVGGEHIRNGRHGYDLDRIGRLHKHASTEALESELQGAIETEENSFGSTTKRKLLQGLLHYRDDSEHGWEDAVDLDLSRIHRVRASEDEIRDNARECFDNLDPAVGALTMSHIKSFEADDPSNSSWIGVWKGGSNTLKVEKDQSLANGTSTTKHEIGHAMQYALGVAGKSGHDNTDRSRRNPDNWDFTVHKSHLEGDELGSEMAEELEAEIDRYKERADDGHPFDVECREYQRTNTNEFIAVTFAHWQDDRSKLDQKHPEMAKFWDKHVGNEDPVSEPVEFEESEFSDDREDITEFTYDEVIEAIERTYNDADARLIAEETATAAEAADQMRDEFIDGQDAVDQVEEELQAIHDGGAREFPDDIKPGDRVRLVTEDGREFDYHKVDANFGSEIDVAGPERNTFPADEIDQVEVYGDGADGADDPQDDDTALYPGDLRGMTDRETQDMIGGEDLQIEYDSSVGGGTESLSGVQLQELTDQTLWVRDPSERGPASETNIPLDQLNKVETY